LATASSSAERVRVSFAAAAAVGWAPVQDRSASEATMQQRAPQLRFATTRLASGLRIHYGEQGDPGGAPILFLPAYTDS
jgi:hypothetical protein